MKVLTVQKKNFFFHLDYILHAGSWNCHVDKWNTPLSAAHQNLAMKHLKSKMSWATWATHTQMLKSTLNLFSSLKEELINTGSLCL